MSPTPKITLDMSDGERRVYLPVCASCTIKPKRWEIWLDGVKKYQVPHDDVLVDKDIGLDMPITSGPHRITVQAIFPDGKVAKETRNIVVK